jgi:hypothetical protein
MKRERERERRVSKEEIKLCVLAADMIVYPKTAKNPLESTKKPLEP